MEKVILFDGVGLYQKEEKMGTFLKYVFYLVLIIVIYLVGKGIYQGDINEKTTVGEVADTVESGAAQMAKDGKTDRDEPFVSHLKLLFFLRSFSRSMAEDTKKRPAGLVFFYWLRLSDSNR